MQSNYHPHTRHQYPGSPQAVAAGYPEYDKQPAMDYYLPTRANSARERSSRDGHPPDSAAVDPLQQPSNQAHRALPIPPDNQPSYLHPAYVEDASMTHSNLFNQSFPPPVQSHHHQHHSPHPQSSPHASYTAQAHPYPHLPPPSTNTLEYSRDSVPPRSKHGRFTSQHAPRPSFGPRPLPQNPSGQGPPLPTPTAPYLSHDPSPPQDPYATPTHLASNLPTHPTHHYPTAQQLSPPPNRPPALDTHYARDAYPAVPPAAESFTSSHPPPPPQASLPLPLPPRPTPTPYHDSLVRNHSTAGDYHNEPSYRHPYPLPPTPGGPSRPPESAPVLSAGPTNPSHYFPQNSKRVGQLTFDNRQHYINQHLQRISLDIEGPSAQPFPYPPDSAYASASGGDESTLPVSPHASTPSLGRSSELSSTVYASQPSSSMCHLPMGRRATDSSVPLSPPIHPHRVSDGGQLYSPVSSSSNHEGQRDRSSLPRRSRSGNERALSVSSANSLPNRVISPSERSQASFARKTIPPVYPAMLSRVADAFRLLIQPRVHIKDSLEYYDCFSGSSAVDTISAIIHTTDRNLALLLGRALDAQRFFHDVTYEHRLRDSDDELYVFHEAVQSPFAQIEDDETTLRSAVSTDSFLPNGVFTPLADCYSPTCSTEQICYSITCPRRLEQTAQMRMSANEVVKQTLTLTTTEDRKEERLWSKTVPQQIVDSVSKQELKRQEMIFELVYTEKDYVRDLELLNEIYLKPIQNRDIIPQEKRQRFMFGIFFNILTVLSHNLAFRDALCRRQSEGYIVDQIGDIVLTHVSQFNPYVRYGAHQVLARHFLDLERNRNKRFDKFLEDQERHPEARKLSIHSFLNRPTSRLGRYPLLLEGILKASPENHPDVASLTKAVATIKDFLTQINAETGKAQNRVNLSKLKDQLQCKPADTNDLNLMHEGRQIIQQGPLKKRSSVETTEINCFLLDHMFFMAKRKKGKENGSIEYKIFKRPIPLELLTVNCPDEQSEVNGTVGAGASPATPTASSGAAGMITSSVAGLAKPLGRSAAVFSSTTNLPNSPMQRAGGDNLAAGKGGFPIILTHLGRRGGTHTFYASSFAERREWVENLTKQRDIKTKQNMKFELIPLTSITFPIFNRVNTSVTFDHNRRVAIGTDQGIYVGLNNDPESFEKLPLPQEKVLQIDVLEEYNIFFVLSDKDRNLWSYPLEALNPTLAVNAKPKKVHSHITFFKAGMCLDRILVCSVRSSNITTIIKSDEPISPSQIRRNKSFGRFLPRGNQEILRPYKEFYIPSETSSLHLFKALIIVGCLKGFEIVNPLTSKTQELLDPKDDSLNFVRKRENIRPIAIFKVQGGDFLLCYDELAFYVNKNGQRARPHWIIHWEGEPNSFSLCYPYILAFNPFFIEIRHVESGQLEQVIITGNSSSLCTDPNSIHCVATPTLTDPQRVYKLLPTSKSAHRHTY